MAIFGKSLAGAGYVVLNVFRVMNILSLLAVMAASSVMLVRTFNNNSFFFFDACEHVVRVVISGFLILTELPLFKKYFSRKWPLFSHSSGFVMLGVAMLLLGNGILANLNKENASPDKIGLQFWQLVISSGIVVIIMGAINIFASYIFRDTKMQLTARQVRSHGAVASHKLEVESSIAASSPKVSRRSRYRSFFLPNGKRDSLPSYHPRTYMTETQATPSMHTAATMSPSHNGKEPFLRSPGAASSKYSVASGSGGLPRPDLAHHPAMIRGNVI